MCTFDDHVRRALDSLPKSIAAKLENVAVVVEEENHDDPDLLGLFVSNPYLPDRIAIYRRPLIEEYGDDPVSLEREIRVTVLHELAHYFGIDEDRLDELGYS
ncbi:MAG TPA: metallopeptidase family protein [Gaiellaceae bacterium]|nr:metallopeptidase family protein [Gaiellaceae bacterium]